MDPSTIYCILSFFWPLSSSKILANSFLPAGKRAAEDELLAKFPYSGVALRPGFIHGVRRVGKMKLPLNAIGSPLELLLKHKAISQVPMLGKLLVPPVKVTTVAKVAVRSAIDNSIPPGVMDVWSILRFGEDE